MSEIFDIIIAVNRLKDQVKELNARIDNLCKYPSLIAFDKYVDQPTACKLLHVGRSKLIRMREAGAISFTCNNRQILYPVSAITKYLSDHTTSYQNVA